MRLIVLFLALACNALSASIWIETLDGGGDAHQFPINAQVTSGNGALTDILGNLVNGTSGADMYEIHISDFANFSAITVPLGPNGVADPAIYLFDSTGHGVYVNHDRSASNTQARLPAGNLNGPQSDGLYFLLITAEGNDPLNKFFNPIFCSCAPGVFGPQTANTVITHYSNAGVGDTASGIYDLHLTGVEFAQTPEPGTLGLLTLGVALLYFSRTKFPTKSASIPEE